MKKELLGGNLHCLRCLGPKPVGVVGLGIALSRRGPIAICSTCGTEEAMLDAGLVERGDIDLVREWRLSNLLPAREGLKKPTHKGSGKNLNVMSSALARAKAIKRTSK